jgi:hypothetical protein
MINALLVLSIPFIAILIMVIVIIHRTDTSDIKIGNMKQAVEAGAIGGLAVIIIICLVFVYFLMIPPIPDIEIGRINKSAAEGIICSKNKMSYLFNPFYSLLYRVGVYVEHPDKPGVLSRAKKHVLKLNWWDGQWNIQGLNIKKSDTIHVFLLKKDAVRNNTYHDNLKKEKSYFMFEDEQIPYGKDKEAEIITYDARVLE